MSDANRIGTMTADNLFAGSQMPVVDDEVIIAEGEGVLDRGTLLGMVTEGSVALTAAAAAVEGDNTGEGTLVLDATKAVQEGARAGVYTVRVIRAAAAEVATTPAVPAQLAVAVMKGPDGKVLEVFDVPGSAGVTIENELKFVMTEDDTTKFIAGDGFDITVTATATDASGLYKAVDSTATDGSADPVAVLAFAVDATEDDVVGVAYFTGEFNEAALSFGGDGDTVDSFRAAARDRGIFFKKVR
ncbi:MAG: head decoration protein [Aminivibrio sp.]|jgi:hypothetical protein